MHRAVMLLALGALVGCNAPPVPPIGARRDGPPQHGGTLHAATFADIRNLDPAVTFDEGGKVFEQLLYDVLVDYDANGEIQPELAERFDVSPDGLRYSFTLRQHVLFHDGEELTAEDVKRSIERTLAHDTPCPAPSFFANIRGYGPFHDGTQGADGKTTYAAHLEGVVVDGRYALHIELADPDATFLAVMTLPFLAPVCRSAGTAYARDWTPCGTGPFKLVAWEQGLRVRLTRHQGYFRPGLPYLDGVDWALLMPSLTQRFKFETGEIDTMREFRMSDLVRYVHDPRWAPYGQWEYAKGTLGVFMNTQMAPFDNAELRRAVAAAIDWDEVAKLREGSVVPTHQMIPPAVAGYDPSFRGQVHDVAAALEHMRNAGYPYDPATGRGGLPGVVRYVGNADGFDSAAAQVIQQQLARIGVRIEIQIMSWPRFLAMTARRGTAQMGYGGWSLDYPDASDFFEPILSSDSIQDEETQNYSFYSNPELDALLKRAHRELDPKARGAMYRRAEEIVRDDAPWAVGYGYRYYELVQPYVHDYVVDRTHTQNVRFVWLDRREAAGTASAAPRRPVWALTRPFGGR